MSSTGEQTHKRQTHRSPNFPAIGLEKALGRAKELYLQEKRHAAPSAVILSHWGYKNPKSSTATMSIAALKYFGLLILSGKGENRQGKLSELALDIILDERPNSPERAARIQEAALKPKIHAELWEEWGAELPSPEAMKHFLLRTKNFNDAAVDQFMNQYRDTVAFAKLRLSGTIVEEEEPNDEEVGAQIGDFVQWTSGGSARFQEPKKLIGVSECGEYAFVEGERGGVPMSQLSVETPLIAAVAGTGTATPPANPFFKPAPPSDGVPLSIKTRPGSVEILTIPKMTRKAFEFLKTQLSAFEDEIVMETSATPQQEETPDES